jgi:hypothetical protein
MSHPHAPRTEDQPTRQPSDAREPRTQAIPIIQPDAQPDVQPGPAAPPAPGPAFLTEAGWPATPAPEAAPSPAPLTPPPPVPPAQMPPPSFPQPVDQVWPLPGVPGDGADRNTALAAQPTDRVDFVPGFGTPDHPPAAAAPAGSTAVTGPSTNELPAAAPSSASRAAPQPAGAGKGAAAKRLSTRLTGGRPGTAARNRTTVLGLGAGLAGLALLELGLARSFGAVSLWSSLPTWSAFASAAAVVALLPLVAGRLPSGPGAATAWKVGLAAAGGLVAFWVLIALPLVASNRGFWLTAGVALAVGALWLAPGRQAARATGTRAEDRRPGSAG